MLIVLEGCDATGKTTLAKLLAKLYNAEIVHCTTETPNTYSFFSQLIYAATGGKNIICDRFCYGQFVYQDEGDRPLALHKLYPMDEHERYVDDSWEALRMLEMEMLRSDVKVIYTWANPNTIADRMISRGENPKDIGRILKGYEDLWSRTLIQPVVFKT